jgi:molecular chaperone DnaJ
MAQTKRDYYEVLGVSRQATSDQIKKAFRNRARHLHPDNMDSGDEHAFKELAAAYEVLCDPHKRSQYDRFGHEGMGNIDFGGIDFSDLGDIGEIFSSFFGGSMRSRRSHAERGADLRYDLSLTFEEAVFGAEKKIKLQHLESCTTCSGSGLAAGAKQVTCAACNGAGQVRHSTSTFLGQFTQVVTCSTCGGEGTTADKPCNECRASGVVRKSKEVEIKIPAGVDDLSQMRVSGQGDQGRRGGPPGDLYVVLNVAPHPIFEREGTTILLRHTISFATAALGGEIMVPTIDGEHKLKVSAGTQSGTTVNLHGCGVPHLGHTSRRGDQIVQLNVRTPARLNAEEKKLFEKLKEIEGKSH